MAQTNNSIVCAKIFGKEEAPPEVDFEAIDLISRRNSTI